MRISDWSSDVCSSDLREGDGLANPVAGVGAAEDRIFEDRVDAAFGVVVGIAVAGRIKARQAKAHPVVIVAELGRGDAGADLRRAAGGEADPVLAQRGREAGGQVDTPDPHVSAVAKLDGVIITTSTIAQHVPEPTTAVEV